MKFAVFFLMLLLPSFMAADTLVSSTADCGAGVVSGYFSANCTVGFNRASAFVSLPSLMDGGILADAFAEGSEGVTASTSLSADFTVTILSGSGGGTGGFYAPCLTATGQGTASASGEMGGVSASFTGNPNFETFYSTCPVGPPFPSMQLDIQPFTFGEPFMISGTFFATAAQAPSLFAPEAFVQFQLIGFELYTATGTPISLANSYTISFPPVVTPEPATATLVTRPIALALFVALAQVLRHRLLGCRRRFPRPRVTFWFGR